MDKQQLRNKVRTALKSLPAAIKVTSSQELCREIKAHLSVCGARVVALFSPLPDEPQVASLIADLSKDKLVVLPRVEGCVMQFYCYSSDCMRPGAYGIMEPCGAEPVEPYEIDAIVVPGVAFTAGGARMGRGKGYYDKYLSQNSFRALKIGVCYSCQLVEHIPLEPHDVKMDVVIHK